MPEDTRASIDVGTPFKNAPEAASAPSTKRWNADYGVVTGCSSMTEAAPFPGSKLTRNATTLGDTW